MSLAIFAFYDPSTRFSQFCPPITHPLPCYLITLHTYHLLNHNMQDRRRVPELHMIVPETWIAGDNRNLKDSIPGCRVTRANPVVRRKGLFSLRLICDTHDTAASTIERFKTERYRSMGVYCEPYLSRKEIEERRRALPNKNMQRQRLKPSREPRRPLSRRSRSRESNRHMRSRESSRRARSQELNRRVRRPDSRPHSRTYARVSDFDIYVDFPTHSPVFRPEDLPVILPTGNYFRSFGSDDDDRTHSSADEDEKMEEGEVKRASVKPHYGASMLYDMYDADIAVYSSDEDLPHLG